MNKITSIKVLINKLGIEKMSDLIKANHKYYKREGIKGHYKYYYTKSEYDKAHSKEKPLKQTETKEFKEWFGNSKVVDEKGEPLVVYHGTNANFSHFEKTSIKIDNLGKGFYFTNDPEIASSYSENRTKERGGAASVLKIYLKLENPFDTRNITKEQAESYLTHYYSLSKYINKDKQKEAVKEDLKDIGTDYHLLFPSNLGASDVQDWLKNEKYDGLIIEGQDKYTKKEGLAYIVFEPTQIKSATGNNGKFNPNNPNITKSKIY